MITPDQLYARLQVLKVVLASAPSGQRADLVQRYDVAHQIARLIMEVDAQIEAELLDPQRPSKPSELRP